MILQTFVSFLARSDNMEKIFGEIALLAQNSPRHCGRDHWRSTTAKHDGTTGGDLCRGRLAKAQADSGSQCQSQKKGRPLEKLTVDRWVWWRPTGSLDNILPIPSNIGTLPSFPSPNRANYSTFREHTVATASLYNGGRPLPIMLCVWAEHTLAVFVESNCEQSVPVRGGSSRSSVQSEH